MSDVRVLIADDHPVVRGGLRRFLDACQGISVIAEACDGDDALARAAETRPDVVLMDLEMPRLDGVEATRALHRRVPGAKVLVLSGFADASRVSGVIEAGVEGYLTKDVSPDALAEAILAVSRSEFAFCPAVVRQLAQRAASPHSRPTGTVTIAFTDIEDSTQILEQCGDVDARVIFRQHDALVRDIVVAHGGSIVEHPGDAFMLAFSGAVSAVECTAAVQRALARAAAECPDNALRVRIGINTGDVICETDGYFGRTVFVAARIAEHARGGEILVSAATQALLAGSAFRLADHGAHALKGLRGPEKIFRVFWDDAADAADARPAAHQMH